MNSNQNSFSGAPWFQRASQNRTTVIGAGGIGSYLVFFLSRLGGIINIIDMDRLEYGNLAGQFYSTSHIGHYKVNALKHTVQNFSNGYPYCTVNAFTFQFQPGKERFLCPYTFSAVDNMKARRDIFNGWKAKWDRELLIDGRLGPNHIQIFAVKKGEEERYESTLFSDDDLPDLPCTFKQTSHIAGMIGTFMTNLYINSLAGYEVPFKTEYAADMLMLRTTD